MAEQASSALVNASSISTRFEIKIMFFYYKIFLYLWLYNWVIHLNYDYRRGNIEGNTRSRVSSRKDSKKSTNNQVDVAILNSDNTEAP